MGHLLEEETSGEGEPTAPITSLTLFAYCVCVGVCALHVRISLFSLHVPLIDLEKRGQLKKTLR